MPDARRRHRWLHPAVALVLPAGLIALGIWQISRVAGEAEGFAARAERVQASIARLQPLAARDPSATIRFTSDPQAYPVDRALEMMQRAETELTRDAWIDRARGWAAWAAVAGGAVALLAVLGCLAAATLGAWRGRRSRAALVGAFRAVMRMLPPLLGLVTVATAVAVVGAVLFESGGVWFRNSINTGEVKLILLGLALAVGGVLIAVNSVRQLRRALQAFTPEPMQVLGRAAGPGEAPGLWAFLQQVAAGQGAAGPDNVVVGMTEGFFVTSSAMRLLPENRVVTGRTLYVPAPFLPLLSQGETAAVIAHELAHFTGEDTAYSQHFLPLYAGMSRSMDAVSSHQAAQGWISAVFQPAAVLAGHVMDTFSRTVAHWSRLRELEADRASLGVGHGQAAASALVRTGISAGLIGGAMDEMYERPAQADPDLVATVMARAGALGFTDPARHLEDRQPHPTDSHPPTRQRIESLGIPVDGALLTLASRPLQAEDVAFTEGLFADWPDFRRALGDDLLAVAVAHDRQFQARLEEAAGAVVDDVPIHERARLAAVALAICGAVLALIGLFVAGVALGTDWAGTRNTLPLAGLGAAVVLAGGLFLVAAWMRERRGRAGPFLVVGREGVRCIGLAGLLPWSGVAGIQVMTGQAFVTTFFLNAAHPLPEQTGHRWSVKVDRRKRRVVLKGLVPQGMTPQAYLDLLNSALRAHRATELLREREAAGAGLDK